MTALFRPARLGLAVALVAWCLCLAGCGSKITRDNFDKIKTGMSRSDVEAILGSPTKTLGDEKKAIAVWKDDENQIKVAYEDGKVAFHRFLNIKELKEKLKQFKPKVNP